MRRMREWMLQWYMVWAEQIGDEAALRAAEEEQKRRWRMQASTNGGGVLPIAGERDA